ncbi:hypothetical protein V7x_47010 [Crateriforma conspicua]|uniref:Uncharacterized protein n=1 Tax=Crateriforma conspicua TaxID=2527996 RepID=A0A5C6FNS8_9PLAN|nr:hypothetical protein V7x_47010 [Crateriforma conspicua]
MLKSKYRLSTLLCLTTIAAFTVGTLLKFHAFALLLWWLASFIAAIVGFLLGNARMPRSWTICATITSVVFSVWFLTYGPATRRFSNRHAAHIYYTNGIPSNSWNDTFYHTVYTPISASVMSAPQPIQRSAARYLQWWLPGHAEVDLRVDDSIGFYSTSPAHPGRAIIYRLF